MIRNIFAAVLLGAPIMVSAQAIKPPPEMRLFTAKEQAAVEMPDLAFEPTPGDIETYDKYFYFHRDDTSFDQAFHDIGECDALASGLSFNSYGGTYYSPYGGVLGGAIGSAIGSAMADAIFGSAERRRIRRINMRNCLGFKGYARFGMEKERWQSFHFEEGNGTVEIDKRLGYLMKQAKVASGPKPLQEALEP